MLPAESRAIPLSAYLAALPREGREDLANHLQVSLLCVGLVARGYTVPSAGTLTLPQVHRLLTAATARLEAARAGLHAQDAGGALG